MRQIFVCIVMFLLFFNVFSSTEHNEILQQGKKLYRLEKATQLASMHFIKYFSEKTDSITGYFSYETEDQIITIFYHKFEQVSLLARYTAKFISDEWEPDLPQTRNLILSEKEHDLITIREEAVKRISKNTDGVFTIYKEIPFNLIPIIEDKIKVVYVTSGSVVSDFLFLGNDYKLKYNNKNKFRGVERIHKSLIKLPLKYTGIDKDARATLHNHLLSPIISEVDICILLLYKEFIDWDVHYVFSKKYVSVFNLRDEKLAVMKKSKWKKINSK